MNKYTYERGEWKDATTLPEWNDGEEHEQWLERCGYNSHPTRFGQDHSSLFEVFKSKNDESYLVTISPDGSECHDILTPDLPSLMMFMRDYGPAFSLHGIGNELDLIRSLVERLFRIYHGHGWHSSCMTCDPEGVKEFEVVKARLREQE